MGRRRWRCVLQIHRIDRHIIAPHRPGRKALPNWREPIQLDRDLPVIRPVIAHPKKRVLASIQDHIAVLGGFDHGNPGFCRALAWLDRRRTRPELLAHGAKLGIYEPKFRHVTSLGDGRVNVGHADRGYSQSLLAVALWRRSYGPDSQPADLDEAVTSCRECLASWPPGHAKRPTVLYTLSAVLKERYVRDAQPADLDGAVSAGREAISARKPGIPNTAYGMTLGGALWARFKRNRQRADLDELVDVMQEAMNAVPPSHRDHVLAARNHAFALTERASLTNQLQHADQALQANRYLLEILPPSAPQRAEAQLEAENILRWKSFMHPDA